MSRSRLDNAFWQSSAVSIASGNNAYGTDTVVVSSVPFYSRKMVVFISTAGSAAGALQLSIDSLVVVPFLIADGPSAFSPPAIELDLNVKAGASISIAAAAYNTTQTYSVSILLLGSNTSQPAALYSNPGISLSNANFQVASAGAATWTALGPALSLPAQSVRIYQNTNNTPFTFSLGYGPSSSSITTIINGAPVMASSAYVWSGVDIPIYIPSGNILYAQQSVSAGAFWPLVKH